MARLSVGGNILAIIFAFGRHYNGNYTQRAAAMWTGRVHCHWMWGSSLASLASLASSSVSREAATCSTDADAQNSDGRQSALTLMLTSTALSLTGKRAAAPCADPSPRPRPRPGLLPLLDGPSGQRMRIPNTLHNSLQLNTNYLIVAFLNKVLI